MGGGREAPWGKKSKIHFFYKSIPNHADYCAGYADDYNYIVEAAHANSLLMLVSCPVVLIFKLVWKVDWVLADSFGIWVQQICTHLTILQ